MGGEFAQTTEWNVNQSLDWHLLEYAPHRGMQQCIKRLNDLYRNEPALYEKSFSAEGFQWVEYGDRQNSVFAYIRKGHDRFNDLVIVLNLTPVIRRNYRIGVPVSGEWQILFNSDDLDFYGSGLSVENPATNAVSWMDMPFSIAVDLPPLGGLVFKLVK